MKLVLNIVGGVIFLAGLVFFLQGLNILPGSFMSGNPQWVVNGSDHDGGGAGIICIRQPPQIIHG